jgi:hypothetical protein
MRAGAPPQVIEAFVAEMGATLAQPVIINRSIEPAGVIHDVARWLACQIAAREAVWALIGAGALVPRSEMRSLRSRPVRHPRPVSNRQRPIDSNARR